MIRYQPPKSAVWGHQVGRLKATIIVDRCLKFLHAQCAIIDSQPSELIVGWNSGIHSLVSEVAAEIDQTLGQPTRVNELPREDGGIFRQFWWPFHADKLPVVANWFDRLAECPKAQDVVAQASTFWTFAWRDEPPPFVPLQSPGGMFGIHLGQPHRITTMFSFRDVERYLRIKAYLAELELVELSDKHLRPKINMNTSERG